MESFSSGEETRRLISICILVSSDILGAELLSVRSFWINSCASKEKMAPQAVSSLQKGYPEMIR